MICLGFEKIAFIYKISSLKITIGLVDNLDIIYGKSWLNFSNISVQCILIEVFCS